MLPLDYISILQDMPKNYGLLNAGRVMRPELAGEDFSYPNPSRLVEPRELRTTIGNMDPWEWAALEYCENTDHLEHKIHQTRDGLMCRSKSEAIIYDIYKSLGLPFHYDEVLRSGSSLISPDFYGVRRDGIFIAHEHKGMHTQEYYERNDWKDGLYAVSGFRQGNNLLQTFDSPGGRLNVKLIEDLIRDIYQL